MGLLPLTYRRPSHVDRPPTGQSQGSSSSTARERSDESLRSGRSSSSGGIPSALSFDKIIEGGTCPPCTVRDFMNYLIYVERSAENLQFFLWHRDYAARFRQAPASELALAPEWTQAQEDETVARIQKEAAEKTRRGAQPQPDMFRGTDFEKPGLQESSVSYPPHGGGGGGGGGDDHRFVTPPQTPPQHQHQQDGGGGRYAGSKDQESSFDLGSSAGSGTTVVSTSYRTLAGAAYHAAGAKQPFTIQPFRSEIDRVVATYIADRSPRQLNLSSKEQKSVLHALSHTTHPSALRSVAASIEAGLRQQAHPNFIRWSICNGNGARVCFARWLGAGTIALATAAAVLLALSRAPRGFRALAAVGWVVGFATLAASAKGMCVVLHGLHHRHVRPWELFEPDEGEDGGESDRKEGEARSFESFGSSNSFEHEPWVVKYDRRNVVRKVFDREVWIQEPALRQIQDTIFVQSIVGAVLVSAALTGLFVGVPGGHFF